MMPGWRVTPAAASVAREDVLVLAGGACVSGAER
jgi:hypothetical protein